MSPLKILLPATLACAVLLGSAGTAFVDVKVEYDKTYNFATVTSWGWSPKPGNVMMARTADDDPEAMRAFAEPIILDAVATEMKARRVPSASQPAVFVTYYLLLSTTMSSQTVGQFLPATAAWGLPPFAPATQALKVMNRGSLVLDVSAKETVIWRGVAQANVKFSADDRQREALLREGIRDLLKHFPPKP